MKILGSERYERGPVKAGIAVELRQDAERRGDWNGRDLDNTRPAVYEQRQRYVIPAGG